MRSKPNVTGRRRLSAGGAALLVSAARAAVAAVMSSGRASGATQPAPSTRAGAAAVAAGATTPFNNYEAEAGTLGGGATVASLTAAPTTQYASATLEASGHGYVHLAGTGQSVKWTNNTGAPITAINVRESIPDSAS